MDDNHRPQLQSTLVQMFSIKPFNGLQLTQLKRKGNQTNQKKEKKQRHGQTIEQERPHTSTKKENSPYIPNLEVE